MPSCRPEVSIFFFYMFIYGFVSLTIYPLSSLRTGTLPVLFILYPHCLVLCLTHGRCSTLSIYFMKIRGPWESGGLYCVNLGESLSLFQPQLSHYLMWFLFGDLLAVSLWLNIGSIRSGTSSVRMPGTKQVLS